jgi:class 3 adenylate cyclase
VPRLQRKSFSTPDEVRRFPHGHVDIVNLDETVLGRFALSPGWRWSKDVKPIAGTASCQHRHVGYVMSGHLHVVMEDGIEVEVRKGDAYEIPPGHDAWVVGDAPWEAIESGSIRAFAVAPHEADTSVLATVLFTDIIDSTATLARLGDTAWRRLLLAHNERLRLEIDRFRGREIATTGDGFLALFDGAARAIRCAASMGAAVRDLGLRIRAGLHTGEVTLAGGTARGVAVHVAARVAALAGPGEVFVTATTHDSVDGSGLEFADRGSHELKGLKGARAVFALLSVPP